MMKCYRCKRKSDFTHLQRKVCTRCFCQLFEKRISKAIREYTQDFDAEGISKVLIEKIVPHRINGKLKLHQETADDIAEHKLSMICENKKVNEIRSILKYVTDKEVQRYAKINNLTFRPKKKKMKKFFDIITQGEEHMIFTFCGNV